ncbi:hypothetical protein D9M71_72240 [compost metagenome]
MLTDLGRQFAGAAEHCAGFGQMKQMQAFGVFSRPGDEGRGALPVHAREQGEHCAFGRLMQAVEERFQVGGAQPVFVRQPEHLAAIADRAQNPVTELALVAARTVVVDPVDLAVLHARLLDDVPIGAAVPALHRQRSIRDALCRALGIELPALQIMGGGAFRQIDIVQTLDQCLHRFQLPEQER